MSFDFEIVIDDFYLSIFPDITEDRHLYKNKKILSILNSFEDGKWRKEFFLDFLKDNIYFATLSSRERSSLIDTQSYGSLIRKSFQNLRLTKAKDKDGKVLNQSDGEIAEIFLYGIMQRHFKALSVIPKIFYKQNSQDPIKGADSVHICLYGDCDFLLCLGEAKFYKTFDYGVIVESVFDTFNSEKLRKENSLITNYEDLSLEVEDERVLKKIKDTLSFSTSLDETKKRLLIPILIMHECNITRQAKSLDDAYLNKIKEFHKNKAKTYFTKQIEKQKENKSYLYEEIKFIFIVFPVPNKKDITEAMTREIKHYQDK